MALKPEQKINPEKNHTRSVRSSNNKHSTNPYSQLEFPLKQTDDFTVNRATVKSSDVYNASTCVPKHNVQVVTNKSFSLMDDTFKLNYEELKNKPMPFMLPPQWTSYQTMVGDGAVQLEDISTSESDTTSTVGLEQAAGVECIGIEQLKLQGSILDSDGQSKEVEHWTPLLQSYCEGVYVFGNNRLAIMKDQSP